MREIFRGWKRKAGVVALLMACLLATGWMITFRGVNYRYFDLGFNRLEYLHRASINTMWIHLHTKSAANHGFIYKRIARGDTLPLAERVDRQYLNFCGIYLKTFDAAEASGFVLGVPCGFFTFTLSLLSAWFLLSKQGDRKSAQVPDPES